MSGNSTESIAEDAAVNETLLSKLLNGELNVAVEITP